MTLRSWSKMEHDLGPADPEYGEWWWTRVETWITYYWWPTRRWMPRLSLWWGYHIRRFPKPPPLHLDPIARHHGWIEGVPACQGPVCQEHEWRVPTRAGANES